VVTDEAIVTAQVRPRPDLISLNGQFICSIVKRHHEELLFLFILWVSESQGACLFDLEVPTRCFRGPTVLQSTVTFSIAEMFPRRYRVVESKVP
jgi:hypothetical protein